MVRFSRSSIAALPLLTTLRLAVLADREKDRPGPVEVLVKDPDVLVRDRSGKPGPEDPPGHVAGIEAKDFECRLGHVHVLF
jgi:hypothetical protein